MVADHMRKRLNGASIALTGSSSWDHSRTKKKKLESQKSVLNAKSHILLEWDGRQNKVIAKREQVSLCQRDLRSFINSVAQNRNVLADVFAVPREIFGLENLKEVLTYEVWQNHLSENERNFLAQFLPGGLEQEEVVRSLVVGENFHFGNPFLKWGSSLCSGNLHPDTVSCREECLIADKRLYYSQIKKYHIDMINFLQIVKEGWESSKDPENEVPTQILRLRRGSQKKNPKVRNRFRDFDHNVAGTSESYSLAAEEKAPSSDDHISLVDNGVDLKERIHEKGSAKEKHKKLFVSSDDAKRADKLKRGNINHCDGAEYMSYLKISKKQLDLVKSMKQSGNIHAKSLNGILGNIDTLHVQPYEEFVKEEKRKLKEHWLQVAINDLPAAYAKWREAQLMRGEIIKSLVQEMEEKLKPLLEDEVTDNPEVVIQEQNNQGERSVEAIEQDDVEEEQENQNDQGSISHRTSEEGDRKVGSSSPEDQNEQGTRNEESSMENYGDTGSGSLQCQSPGQNSFLSSGHEPDPMNVESDNILEDSKSDCSSPHRSECSMKANTPVDSLGPVNPLFSDGNWYSQDTKNEDSPKSQGVSVSSGGSLHSGDALDAGASTQGLPISSGGNWYSQDTKNKDSPTSQGVSVSSGGILSSGDAVNACASTQGVPISSGGNWYSQDTMNKDSPTSQGVSVSSGGILHSGDAINTVASTHGVPISSGGAVYVVAVNNADDSISKPVPNPIPISSVDRSAFDMNTSLIQSISITSGADMYAVDAKRADGSPGQRVSITSVGDVYSLDANSANTSLVQRVPISSAADICLQDANNTNASIGQGAIPCGGDWPVVNMGHSYYNSTAKEVYESSQCLSLPCEVNRQQHPQLIDLECDMHEEDTGKDILHRQCGESSYSYPNPDRSGLLQSLFNGQQMSYRQEQKPTGSDFQLPNNVLLQDGLFTGNIPGNLRPLMPMELGKKRISENYVNQNVTHESYPEGGGFLIPRQPRAPPVHLPDWAINSVRMPTRIQSHLPDDGMLSQNWFPSELQVRGGWSRPNTASVPSQTFGNNADQSLYSVLSQCNQMRSERRLDAMGPNEQFMLPRNFGMVGAVASRIGNIPQASNPLDYLGGRDTGSSLMPDDMGWVNLPQNSTLQDTMEKPYLRSWNQ